MSEQRRFKCQRCGRRTEIPWSTSPNGIPDGWRVMEFKASLDDKTPTGGVLCDDCVSDVRIFFEGSAKR